MNWIKVTPETMPLDRTLVLVTIVYDDGVKGVMPDCIWNGEYKKWERLYEAGTVYWSDLTEEVTHWMPYPEPADG